MAKVADGDDQPVFYVSPLDPGIGKTSALAAFLRALATSPKHKGVGAMVGVSRKDQISALANLCGFDREQFGVLTAERELNETGADSPNSAQILFTTQQMIQRRCFEKKFADVGAFYFRGRPRVLRAWDETMLPAEPICITRHDISHTFRDLSKHYPKQSEFLQKLFNDLDELEDGSTYALGDTASEWGGNLREVVVNPRGLKDEDADVVRKLVAATNKTFLVRRPLYIDQPVLVGHADLFPSDFAPVVILDASARVRGSYALWKRYRKSLISLKPATKDYSNLTVHWWNKGAGRSSIKSNPAYYAHAIAKTINEAPPGEWLVVHHKARDGRKYHAEDASLLQQIIGLVDQSERKLHPLSWGRHNAINDYVDVPRVVLAGGLYYPEVEYEARASAASGLDVPDEKLSKREINEFTLGEDLDLILQAACRGAIRIMAPHTQLQCDLYLIASRQRGIQRKLETLFPGCRIVDWDPAPRDLSGRVKQAADYLEAHFRAHPAQNVLFTDLRSHLGIKSSPQLTQGVRQHPAFQDWLRDNDVEEHGPSSRRKTCFRKRPASN